MKMTLLTPPNPAPPQTKTQKYPSGAPDEQIFSQQCYINNRYHHNNITSVIDIFITMLHQYQI